FNFPRLEPVVRVHPDLPLAKPRPASRTDASLAGIWKLQALFRGGIHDVGTVRGHIERLLMPVHHDRHTRQVIRTTSHGGCRAWLCGPSTRHPIAFNVNSSLVHAEFH